MKLKKSVKVVLVLVLFILIGGSFYTFNRWFFTKYKDVGKKAENQNVEENKESQENFPNSSTSPNETVDDTQPGENDTKQNEKKIRPSEIYYCSNGDILEGQECITKVETSLIEVSNIENKEYSKLVIPSYDSEELKGELEKICEQYNGIFEQTSDSEVSCYVPEDGEKETMDYICLDGFTKEGNKCVKNVKIPAKVRYGCPEGTQLDGIYCT